MSGRSSDSDGAVAALLDAVRRDTDAAPFDLAVILGSGWGGGLDEATCLAEFPYRDWPCFPPGAVVGHAGRLQAHRWRGRKVLTFAGRWHCYQGLTAWQATMPVRLAATLGARRLLLTCAAGGIRNTFVPGDFLLVRDHLNLLGDNPLKAPAAPFVDLTALYRTAEFEVLADAVRRHGRTLHRGVLAAMPGPSYETPAEIDMLERLGADAVAMSTVPEAIMGRSLGMEVTALALIANRAAGRGDGAIGHAEVLACGTGAAPAARALLGTLIDRWPPGVVGTPPLS